MTINSSLETTTMTTTSTDFEALRKRLHQLGLFGLLAQDNTLLSEPWVGSLITIEQNERQRRSLVRRLRDAKLGPFKPLADFDWQWPQRIDRELFTELLGGEFIAEATNVVLVGPNGASARFVTASDMLHDLAAQDSSAALSRRLKRYTSPHILAIDEIGYLDYDNRYADLLFEVATRRYQLRPIIVTTNRAFADWNDIFPNAACVVTLIDRLVHRCEILPIEASSYRLKEAQERAEQRKAARPKQQKKTLAK
jgi:DNA replication protein DnaC